MTRPLVWYGSQVGATGFYWYCQTCKAMDTLPLLSAAWTAGETHRKTVPHAD